MSTAEDFLNEPDAKPVKHEVAGKEVWVQILTAEERDHCYDPKAETLERKARLLEVGIVDSAGKPVFTPEQATEMMMKRSNVTEKLVGLVVRANNATEDTETLGNES